MNTQQVTKNAITLKGSAVIIADYLSEYALFDYIMPVLFAIQSNCTFFVFRLCH